MEASIQVIPKDRVFIVDNDFYNGLAMQRSLEQNLGQQIAVKVFPDAESCLAAMDQKDEQPSIVIVEYTENKRINEEKGAHMVDQIKRLNEDAAIIIIADKPNSARATKALAYGAHEFVIKDQFMHEHILSAVKKCLHPAKM